MASANGKAMSAIEIISELNSIDTLISKIRNKALNEPSGSNLPFEQSITAEGTDRRLAFLLEQTGKEMEFVAGKRTFPDLKQFEGNIENYIGLSIIPTGVVGPLRVIGSAANGDFYIPLATSEGALVASYHRGAKACSLAGGATSICLVEGVQRSPLFKFNDIAELGQFLIWLLPQMEKFREITEAASRFAKLTEIKTNIEGNHLILTFEFHTGDASGQNMVTICTDAICHYIIDHAPVQPLFWFIESNYSGDKKATALSFSTVRGKKVTTEITLSEKIVNEVLKTTPKAMSDYWKSSTMGTIQSGAIGAQGHYANGLAALFLATGQDVACVSEAAVGITRMEVISGSLYASVTLPNLIVGTVGGGTGLPTQRECLELMGCYGEGKARKYAEICGALVLAGELSIAAALSAGHFSSAHKKIRKEKMSSNLINTGLLAILFLALFGVAELLYYQFKVRTELTRKLVHVGTGLLTLLFPILLYDHWLVLLLCSTFAFIILGSLRFNFLRSINGVARKSHGSIFYPVSVYGCYLIYNYYFLKNTGSTSPYIYFYLPILTLAVCDPVAAIVGMRYPYGRYKIGKNTKTMTGSLSFFVSSFLLTLTVFRCLSHSVFNLPILPLSLLIAVSAAMIEALSGQGIDNITIPATVVLLLILFT